MANHVYIDDQAVAPALVQASDTGGDEFFVNKYGEIKTASELQGLQRTSENSAQYLLRLVLFTRNILTINFHLLSFSAAKFNRDRRRFRLMIT